MAIPTYTPLANLTLSSSAASVTFSSISQAYRDLVLVVEGSLSNANQTFGLRFNGDTGTNYNEVFATGTGTATSSNALSSSDRIYLNYNMAVAINTSMNFVTNIMDYSATDKHKSVLLRANVPTGTAPGVEMTAGRWANTAAVTSVVVFAGAGSISAGSTFALYGVAA